MYKEGLIMSKLELNHKYWGLVTFGQNEQIRWTKCEKSENKCALSSFPVEGERRDKKGYYEMVIQA